MNCHAQIWITSQYLEPVRESYRTDRPLHWIKVNDLPDFVYFNHSVHIKKGMGCATCHGRVDRMPLLWQKASLQMEWCLDCHRQPGQYVRPREAVFQMDYEAPANQAELGARLVKEYDIQSLTQLLGLPQVGRTVTRRFMSVDKTLDLASMRARLDGLRGRQFWRSLEELAETPEFRRCRRARVPAGGGRMVRSGGPPRLPQVDGRLARARRRDRVYASARRAARPVRHARPENMVPGRPLFFATAMPLGAARSDCWPRATRAGRRRSKATRITREPRGHGRLLPGVGAAALRSRIASPSITYLGEIRPWASFVTAMRTRSPSRSALRAPGCAF